MYAITDMGNMRSNNEDQFLLEKISGWTVAAVADGMGGAAGGEVASWLAVDTVRRLIHQNAGRLPVVEMMEDCLLLAHERIRRRGETSFGNINMGTTLTLATVPPPEDADAVTRNLYVAHVGDSRLYLIDVEGIRQVTRDHSMTQHLLDSGVLTEKTARNFRFRNVIYKSLGGSQQLDPDPVACVEVPLGAVLLLCSDGLSNSIEPMEMWSIVHHTRDLREAARTMVDLALCRDGTDNITVAVVAVGRPRFASSRPRLPEDADKPRHWQKRRRRLILLLTVLLALLLATLISLGFQ